MSMMEPQQISQCSTISEILKKYPETCQVFIERKTLCVGCYLARFCDLKDVAQAYSLEIETLVYEIQKAAITKINQNSKE